MLDERDVTRLWQQLFRGQTITTQTLAEANSLVDELRPESPLRLRLATELEDIRRMYQAKRTKKTR